MTGTIERSETHSSFTLERSYAVPVERVWHAFSDAEARDRWFGGEGFTITEKAHDFRVGGVTMEDGEWHGGPRSRFVASYTDIVEHHRIVFTYDMWIDERHLSTSLQTVTFTPDGDGTRLTLTEQGVHLDGIDTPEGREEGTSGLLDQLGSYLGT